MNKPKGGKEFGDFWRKSDFSESALSVEEQLMSSTVTPINPEMDDSDEPNVLRQATG